ncbi:MAG TPA: cytochrome ubiquinol oxidase subunit I, partial [Candidatus Latescibacteria bacterium]|nr:cytochrome ubiquinol oxidase subunit I [Candidatus Latescibacterota bacterium]
MNYPFWDVPLLGGGLVIALIAIPHVFVSHFAIGGGIFLAWTERIGIRKGKPEYIAFAKRNTLFFVLMTLVFGAVTGVGIWFSIGLVHPDATSALIHNFVFGWAIEWVLFLVEIAAALLYYYGWDRVDQKTHQFIGWAYAGAAWGSLVVINGILAFMLTPGRWVETGGFWTGFFNPS